MTAPVLHLDEVTVVLSSRFTLRVPSLSIGAGITAVLGHNGSGKSTLLRVLATALAPTSGRYTVSGADATTAPGISATRATLGYLPQDDSCPPRLRVFDHVDLVAVARQIGSGERARRAAVGTALRQVDLVDLAAERCGRLSGGQRRRTAIAAALVGMPNLLVLDEPDSGLDDHQRRLLADELRRRATTATIVVASHDHEWMREVSQRVAFVSGGVVAAASEW